MPTPLFTKYSHNQNQTNASNKQTTCFYGPFSLGLKGLPQSLNCTCCKHGTFQCAQRTSKLPDLRRMRPAGLACKAKFRAKPGLAPDPPRGCPGAPVTRARPRPRQLQAPGRPSHSHWLRTRERPPQRRSSVRERSYLMPLLRKPRNACPAAPGATKGDSAIRLSADTRPRRPRSSQKPRATTVMAATAGSPTQAPPPPLRFSQLQAGLRPHPARRESESHPPRVPGGTLQGRG